MSLTSPTLHLICGKIASGKSTLAKKLALEDGAVVVAEDAWLSALYSDQMSSISDFVYFSTKLRNIMGPHIVSLLNARTSVALDFQANTIESRRWMRSILEQTKASHKLHVLDVSDEICIARLRARNATGDHPFAPTEEQFHQLSKHFSKPAEDEGFDIVVHKSDNAN